MGYHELISWLEIADLSDYSQAQIADALLAGLEDAQGPELIAELTELHQQCLAGDVPAERIKALPTFGQTAESDGARIERELRELARELPESEWRTSNFERIERGVRAAQAGSVEELEDAIDEMRTVLVEAWKPYVDMPLSRNEIVAESVVGHRLLSEGFRGWAIALDLLDAAIEGQADYAVARTRLEEANRLLVAVQFLAKRPGSRQGHSGVPLPGP